MPIDKNAVWFITGCSTGFGREIARVILERGGRAVVTARDADRVADLATEFPERALALALDVTKPDQIADAVKQAEAKFGAIDVLVNNAGYGYMAAIEEGEDDEIRAQFEANVFGLIDMTKAVLPGMRARGRGHVVNLSSQGGLVGFPGVGYYNAIEIRCRRPVRGARPRDTPARPWRDHRGAWAVPHRLGRPLAAHAETGHRSLCRNRRQAPPPDKRLFRHPAGRPRSRGTRDCGGGESPEPPLHLLLGKMAVDIVRGKLAAMGAEIDKWESASLGADFPAGS